MQACRKLAENFLAAAAGGKVLTGFLDPPLSETMSFPSPIANGPETPQAGVDLLTGREQVPTRFASFRPRRPPLTSTKRKIAERIFRRALVALVVATCIFLVSCTFMTLYFVFGRSWSSDFQVDGDSTVQNLSVEQDASVGNLDVAGQSVFTGGLELQGDAGFAGTIDVASVSTFGALSSLAAGFSTGAEAVFAVWSASGASNVSTGSSWLDSDMAFERGLTLRGSLLTVGRDAVVAGASNFSLSSVTAADGTSVGGGLAASAFHLLANGSVSISGAISSSLRVTGGLGLSISGLSVMVIGEDLSLGAATSVNGSVSVGGNAVVGAPNSGSSGMANSSVALLEVGGDVTGKSDLRLAPLSLYVGGSLRSGTAGAASSPFLWESQLSVGQSLVANGSVLVSFGVEGVSKTTVSDNLVLGGALAVNGSISIGASMAVAVPGSLIMATMADSQGMAVAGQLAVSGSAVVSSLGIGSSLSVRGEFDVGAAQLVAVSGNLTLAVSRQGASAEVPALFVTGAMVAPALFQSGPVVPMSPPVVYQLNGPDLLLSSPAVVYGSLSVASTSSAISVLNVSAMLSVAGSMVIGTAAVSAGVLDLRGQMAVLLDENVGSGPGMLVRNGSFAAGSWVSSGTPQVTSFAVGGSLNVGSGIVVSSPTPTVGTALAVGGHLTASGLLSVVADNASIGPVSGAAGSVQNCGLFASQQLTVAASILIRNNLTMQSGTGGCGAVSELTVSGWVSVDPAGRVSGQTALQSSSSLTTTSAILVAQNISVTDSLAGASVIVGAVSATNVVVSGGIVVNAPEPVLLQSLAVGGDMSSRQNVSLTNDSVTTSGLVVVPPTQAAVHVGQNAVLQGGISANGPLAVAQGVVVFGSVTASSSMAVTGNVSVLGEVVASAPVAVGADALVGGGGLVASASHPGVSFTMLRDTYLQSLSSLVDGSSLSGPCIAVAGAASISSASLTIGTGGSPPPESTVLDVFGAATFSSSITVSANLTAPVAAGGWSLAGNLVVNGSLFDSSSPALLLGSVTLSAALTAVGSNLTVATVSSVGGSPWTAGQLLASGSALGYGGVSGIGAMVAGSFNVSGLASFIMQNVSNVPALGPQVFHGRGPFFVGGSAFLAAGAAVVGTSPASGNVVALGSWPGSVSNSSFAMGATVGQSWLQQTVWNVSFAADSLVGGSLGISGNLIASAVAAPAAASSSWSSMLVMGPAGSNPSASLSSMSNASSVAGSVVAGGGLVVVGDCHVGSSASGGQAFSISGPLTVGQNLVVNGSTSSVVQGSLVVGSSLLAAGSIVDSGDLSVQGGDAFVSGSGATSLLGGGLSVGGRLFGSSAVFEGTVMFGSNVTVAGTTSFQSTLIAESDRVLINTSFVVLGANVWSPGMVGPSDGYGAEGPYFWITGANESDTTLQFIGFEQSSSSMLPSAVSLKGALKVFANNTFLVNQLTASSADTLGINTDVALGAGSTIFTQRFVLSPYQLGNLANDAVVFQIAPETAAGSGAWSWASGITIASSGNVGVQQTSPTATLHVGTNINGRATGDVLLVDGGAVQLRSTTGTIFFVDSFELSGGSPPASSVGLRAYQEAATVYTTSGRPSVVFERTDGTGATMPTADVTFSAGGSSAAPVLRVLGAGNVVVGSAAASSGDASLLASPTVQTFDTDLAVRFDTDVAALSTVILSGPVTRTLWYSFCNADGAATSSGFRVAYDGYYTQNGASSGATTQDVLLFDLTAVSGSVPPNCILWNMYNEALATSTTGLALCGDGRIGIKTASLATGKTMTINGATHISNSLQQQGAVQFDVSPSAASYMVKIFGDDGENDGMRLTYFNPSMGASFPFSSLAASNIDVFMFEKTDSLLTVPDGAFAFVNWNGATLTKSLVFQGGNVGVGLSQPQQMLHVGGSPGTFGGRDDVLLYGTVFSYSPSSPYAIEMSSWHTGQGDLLISKTASTVYSIDRDVALTDDLRIDSGVTVYIHGSSARVSIGTTADAGSPYGLYVYGDTHVVSTFETPSGVYFDDDSKKYIDSTYAASNYDGWQMYWQSSPTSEIVINKEDASVTGVSDTAVWVSSYGTVITFRRNISPTFCNVGIGSSKTAPSPLFRLDMAGALRTTGDLTWSGRVYTSASYVAAGSSSLATNPDGTHGLAWSSLSPSSGGTIMFAALRVQYVYATNCWCISSCYDSFSGTWYCCLYTDCAITYLASAIYGGRMNFNAIPATNFVGSVSPAYSFTDAFSSTPSCFVTKESGGGYNSQIYSVSTSSVVISQNTDYRTNSGGGNNIERIFCVGYK